MDTEYKVKLWKWQEWASFIVEHTPQVPVRPHLEALLEMGALYHLKPVRCYNGIDSVWYTFTDAPTAPGLLVTAHGHKWVQIVEGRYTSLTYEPSLEAGPLSKATPFLVSAVDDLCFKYLYQIVSGKHMA